MTRPSRLALILTVVEEVSMIRLPRFAALQSGPALCALLGYLALAVPAQAVEAPFAEPVADSATPVEELVELDEVMVRGKLVANAIITAENIVFRLYNNLNKDNRYDIHCLDLQLNRYRLSMLRTCLPEFLSSYTTPRFHPTAFTGGFVGMQSCGGRSGVDSNGNMYSMTSCPGASYSGASGSFGTYATPYYGNPAARSAPLALTGIVPDDRITDYKENLQRVLGSDPQLLEKANQLAGMYREVERIQTRYVALQEEKRTAKKARLEAARERARSRGRELRPPHPRAP